MATNTEEDKAALYSVRVGFRYRLAQSGLNPGSTLASCETLAQLLDLTVPGSPHL